MPLKCADIFKATSKVRKITLFSLQPFSYFSILLDLTGSQHHYAKGMVDAIAHCDFDPRNLVSLYSELSSEIHGAPWSGPGVEINVKNLQGGATGTSACLLLKIADIFRLPLAATVPLL
jgi:hypothetical protein